MFKIGDLVVHISHGLGKITEIEEREFTRGNKLQFYILTIPDNGAPKKVLVPLEHATTKLRGIVTREYAEQVCSYIRQGKPDSELEHQTWIRRYCEYMERIGTGDLMELAKVYVALTQLQRDQDLNFGERKLMEQARDRILSEFKCHNIEFPDSL